MENSWTVHSITFACLQKMKLIHFYLDPTDQKQKARFNFKDILVDDRIPRNEIVEAIYEETKHLFYIQ